MNTRGWAIFDDFLERFITAFLTIGTLAMIPLTFVHLAEAHWADAGGNALAFMFVGATRQMWMHWWRPACRRVLGRGRRGEP